MEIIDTLKQIYLSKVDWEEIETLSSIKILSKLNPTKEELERVFHSLEIWDDFDLYGATSIIIELLDFRHDTNLIFNAEIDIENEKMIFKWKSGFSPRDRNYTIAALKKYKVPFIEYFEHKNSGSLQNTIRTMFFNVVTKEIPFDDTSRLYVITRLNVSSIQMKEILSRIKIQEGSFFWDSYLTLYFLIRAEELGYSIPEDSVRIMIIHSNKDNSISINVHWNDINERRVYFCNLVHDVLPDITITETSDDELYRTIQ